jgi:hypothetical protein
LAKRAVKIEFEGSTGGRYTIKLEGSLSKDKVMRIMDIYELLAREDSPNVGQAEETKIGRIQTLIQAQFVFRQFTSDEVRNSYEDTYNQPIQLAEVSTYLSRINDQGNVSRLRRGKKWIYSLSTSPEQPVVARGRLRTTKVTNP